MLPRHLIEWALLSAPDAIVICDARGRIEFVSRQVSALFGYEAEELLGRPIEQLLPQRLRGSHRDLRARFAHAPRARAMGEGLELLGCRKNGTEFPVEISLSPIRDGDRLLVAAAIRDATGRRRTERELTLAREAAEAARRLADEASRAKSRFLSTASHDLRQPVQSLALTNGTLRRLVRDPSALEVLELQERAIGAMARLLNALLDISKLEAGSVRPEIREFTVATLFEELRQEFSSLALEKHITLGFEAGGDLLRSDLSLLEQVMRNLVANAIKYTPRGEVRVRCLREPALVWLEVADTGVGIAPDQLPHIFDEFFQVGARSSGTGNGYGLGLSIVRRIVELLELKLEVRSEPGAGSSFRVGVPVGAGS